MPTVARARWLNAVLCCCDGAPPPDPALGGAIEVKSEAPYPCTWRKACDARYFQNEWVNVEISAKSGLKACLVMAAEESKYMELAGALRPLLSPKEQPVDHAASPGTFQGFLINCIPTAQHLLARLWRHEENERKRRQEKKSNAGMEL